MQFNRILLACFWLFFVVLGWSKGNSTNPKTSLSKGAFFRENKGQVKDQNWQPRPDILFSGESNGLTYHLKKDGLHYQLSKIDSWKEETEERGLKHPGKEAHKVPDQMSLYRVDVTWLGANPFCEIITGEARPDYENFYNVPEGVEPALFVKSYASVTYKNLYENIDLKFYQTQDGELEYDFIVHPGGDYKKIQIDIQGATLNLNPKQELEITTPLGTITEGALRVNQDGKPIQAVWALNNESTVSYQIENFNPSADLIIDPPVRLWGTYYGGNHTEYSFSISADGIGNVYLAGQTTSAIEIATIGSHQETYEGSSDAFLVKFDSLGNRLWGTYYGGNSEEKGYSCSADSTGDVYLSGRTASSYNINTSGAHQTTFGGSYDAFLVKFDAFGVRLWGTYYGGSESDEAFFCTSSSNGKVYMAGSTRSTTSIASINAHQTTLNGSEDAFLVKFNASGTRLWGTYYGGGSMDYGISCKTDSHGNIYLTGGTNSPNAIATSGAHQQNFNGGGDAYLVKFNSSGTRLWGTYYGGNGFEFGNCCSTDGFDNVYLSGQTESANSISTLGAHQTTIGSIQYNDAYLIKFDSSGTRLWGTYYGGNNYDYGYSCNTDVNNNVFLAGLTFSTNANAIATVGAHQSAFGGNCDAFLIKFDGLGTRLWGTYYGGINIDYGTSSTSDINGNVFLTGWTWSDTAIASTGAYQTTYNGSIDGYLVKFDNSSAIGINENNFVFNYLNLSPNPGQNQLTISGLPEGTIFDLTILNTLGQVVYFSKELRQSENLNIDLPKGLYEVVIETKEASYAQKWVVE